jgi:hypothetical protein
MRWLGKDWALLLQVIRPERGKYLRAACLSAFHAGLFMLLPGIFSDISGLLEKRLHRPAATPEQTEQNRAVMAEYRWKAAKWGLYFAVVGAATYRRRLEFIQLTNRIGHRLRTVLFRQLVVQRQGKLLEAGLVHHLVTDVRAIS